MRYKRVYNYEIYEFTIQQVSTIHRAVHGVYLRTVFPL